MSANQWAASSIVCCAMLVAAHAGARADEASFLGGLHYRSIGPAVSGGRTTAVVGSDLDKQLYFAGGADGGVFKSTDGGASWRPVFDRVDVAAIGTIVLDSHNPRDVWVGTGESNPRNDVAAGDGVWHSTDGGAHWTHAGLPDAGAISSISIDPSNPRVVVVGVLGQVFRDNATRGIFVTRDGGAHWTRTLFVGPSSGVCALARVPDHPGTLFAGVYQFRREPWTMTSGGPNGGIYRSDDGGEHWRKLTGRGLPHAPTGRIGLAAAKGGRIYAIVQSKEGELWRSDDGGNAWHKMPHSPYVGARPFYFSQVFVDPANRDRLINVELVMSVSTDGGRSFHPVATNAGWDYHATWWSKDGRRIMNGSDEGVVISSDGGADWWQPYDLPFSQAYHAGFDGAMPSYTVCFGLQDNNSWCGPSNANNSVGVLNRDWYIVAPGDGMWSNFDPADVNLVWSTSTNTSTGQLYIWDRRTHQATEVSPYARLTDGEAPKDVAYRFNWETPIAFTADVPPKALLGGNVVFESDDHGVHWRIISPDLTRDDKSHQRFSGGPITRDMSGAETADTIMDVAPSPLEHDLIWVSTDDGLVQLTRDAGARWTNVTPRAMPAWARVPAVEPGHYTTGTAYIAVDHHMSGDDRPYLFVTDDYGATWKSIVGNLPPDLFVRTVREDLRNPQILYAGTQRGVYVTFDRGVRWRSLRLNMPATAIYDIELQPSANDLVVASHGRGIWILDDLRPLQELAGARSAPITLFQPRDAYRMWQWAPINAFTDATLPSNAFVGKNTGAAVISYYLAKPARPVPAIEIVDARGLVVRRLSGRDVPNKAGIDRATWDLLEEGPTRWMSVIDLLAGPKEGAEVVPGTYTVRLRAGGQTLERSIVVKPDPRDSADFSQYRTRHDFMARLYDEFGGVDTMLNDIDARLKHATGAQRTELVAFKHRLTYDPKNDEDASGPPELRERLLNLIERMSSAFQEPTPEQLRESAELTGVYQSLSAEYRTMK
ncbi:MAG: WD40/YVTN/BNR-like repeat-containing protein [Vulcanimicrobiaceae bacterium]